MIVGSWWEKNWKRTGGCGDEGDSGWGCGPGPSEYSGDIDRRGIGSDSVRDDDKSGMLGDNVGGWKEGELESVRQSTRTRLVGGHVPRRIPKEKRRPKYSRRMRREWRGR